MYYLLLAILLYFSTRLLSVHDNSVQNVNNFAIECSESLLLRQRDATHCPREYSNELIRRVKGVVFQAAPACGTCTG